MLNPKKIISSAVSFPLAIKIKGSAHLPLEDSLKMANTMRRYGVSFDICEKQGLFNMTLQEFRSYISKAKPRTYVRAIAEHHDVKEYEVFRQMMHAKEEYGIPYAAFNRFGLYGASEEKLGKHESRQGKKRAEAVTKIAKACDIGEDEAASLVELIGGKFGIGPLSIYKHHLYDASDAEIESFLENRRKAKDDKYDLAMEETGWSKEQLEAHMAKCLSNFHIVSDYYFALQCYNLPDDCLEQALTHDDIYRLCAQFNKKISRVDNKKRFNHNFKQYLGRRFWINTDSSFEEFASFADGLSEVFVKPSDGMHGVGAHKLSLEGADLREVYDDLVKDTELVVEEVVSQHPDMAAFNPTSVNTVRLYTICDDGGNVDYVNAYVRFGNGGIVDNYSSGGFECGVDPKTGVINTNAICKTGEEFESHPITGIKFKGFQIPLWEDALARTREALLSIDGINFVGWDVAIAPDHSVLIEGNCKPGPGAYQKFVLEEGRSIRESFAKYIEMANAAAKTEGKR